MRRVTFKAERSVSVRLFCDGHVLGWCMKFFFFAGLKFLNEMNSVSLPEFEIVFRSKIRQNLAK